MHYMQITNNNINKLNFLDGGGPRARGTAESGHLGLYKMLFHFKVQGFIVQ